MNEVELKRDGCIRTSGFWFLTLVSQILTCRLMEPGASWTTFI